MSICVIYGNHGGGGELYMKMILMQMLVVPLRGRKMLVILTVVTHEIFKTCAVHSYMALLFLYLEQSPKGGGGGGGGGLPWEAPNFSFNY